MSGNCAKETAGVDVKRSLQLRPRTSQSRIADVSALCQTMILRTYISTSKLPTNVTRSSEQSCLTVDPVFRE